MLRSMTGFGRAEGILNDKKVTVEVRSLNSKQLDLLAKVPSAYREKEAELRQWAGERIVRGKSELYIGTEPLKAAKRTAFNAELIRAYHDDLRAATAGLGVDDADLLGHVLRMPDVMNTPREETDPEEWSEVMKLVSEAMEAFNGFRGTEGAKLRDELIARTRNILALLGDVEAMDHGRTDRTRDRILARLQELKADVDQDRVEQELVFYLEKMDITEEKVRLRTHCTYFIDTVTGEEQQGRKLGFISQEMGREINTLGSKCNDAAMQKHVVLMKDELEKIKEQVLNVL